MPNRGKVWNGSEWVDLAPTATLQSATTSAPGITQLVDSVSSTSTASAAVPNSVKTSYDFAATKAKVTVGTAAPVSPATGDIWVNTAGTLTAAQAVALSTYSTTGAILYASGQGTAAALAIGTANQVLSVSAGLPAWSTLSTASTSAYGVTQLTDSTSSTSTTTAATPASVKTAYDTAATAIPKNTVTAAGDILYASGSATPARLAIGTANQVLQVISGLPSWQTLASSGADVQEFTSSGSWVKPAGKSAVYVFALGGGGGGAAGARSSVGVLAKGGNPGAGGAHAQRWMAASELAGTVTVTIGAGGAGGTAVAADTTTINGSSGDIGGNTLFGTHILALGGGPGADSDNATVGLPFTGVWEWGYNLANGGTAGGTTDAGDVNGVLDPSTFSIRNIGPALNFASSSASVVLNAVRAMTRSGHGAKGGLAAATAASSRGGGAGARGFGANGSVPNGGGYAGSGVNATAAQAGSVCTVGVGHGGGGGGPAISATPSAGGAGYLGGGGGGGGGLQTSTARANAAGGAGGGGYVLVVSI